MNATEFKQLLLPLNAKETIEKLNNLDNPQAFCTTLVRNMCIDRHRAASLAVVDKPPEELPIAGDDNASRHIEQQQTAQLLNHCLARLPAQQQQVVRMRDLAGCSMQEIEKATGLTTVNARVVLSRARKSLRELFQSTLSS